MHANTSTTRRLLSSTYEILPVLPVGQLLPSWIVQLRQYNYNSEATSANSTIDPCISKNVDSQLCMVGDALSITGLHLFLRPSTSLCAAFDEDKLKLLQYSHSRMVERFDFPSATQLLTCEEC